MCNPYDKLAEIYDWAFFKNWEHSMENEAKEINKFILKKCDAHFILDYGCGTGLNCIGLSKLNYTSIGVDNSKKMLAMAKKNAQRYACSPEKLSFVRNASILAEIFKKKSFDAIICKGNTLSHFLSKQDLLSSLRSIYNCLRDGGIFISDLRNYESKKIKERLKKHAFYPQKSIKMGSFYTSCVGIWDVEPSNIIRLSIVLTRLTNSEYDVQFIPIYLRRLLEKDLLHLFKQVGFKHVNTYKGRYRDEFRDNLSHDEWEWFTFWEKK